MALSEKEKLERQQFLVKAGAGVVTAVLLGFIIYSFMPSSAFSGRVEYKNSDVDILIENEYKKSLSGLARGFYERAPAGLKKMYLDGFKRGSPQVVDRLKKEALQNAVDNIVIESRIKSSNPQSMNVPRAPMSKIDMEVSSIMRLAEEPFNITLQDGKVVVVKPFVGEMRVWKSPSEPGFIAYDVGRTLSNILPVVEAMTKGLQLQEANRIKEEVYKKVVSTLNEYQNSKYKSAAISAVASAVYRK